MKKRKKKQLKKRGTKALQLPLNIAFIKLKLKIEILCQSFLIYVMVADTRYHCKRMCSRYHGTMGSPLDFFWIPFALFQVNYFKKIPCHLVGIVLIEIMHWLASKGKIKQFLFDLNDSFQKDYGLCCRYVIVGKCIVMIPHAQTMPVEMSLTYICIHISHRCGFFLNFVQKKKKKTCSKSKERMLKINSVCMLNIHVIYCKYHWC